MNAPNQTHRLLIFFVPLDVAVVSVFLLLKGLSAPPPTPAPPTPTPDPAQQIVARVGGQHITLADWAVAYYLDAIMYRLSGQPVPPPGETLNRLVNDALILDAAAGEGIAVSDDDVEARIAQLEAVWGLTDEQVNAELAAFDLTREVWAEAIARLLTVERYLHGVGIDLAAGEHSEALGEWLEAQRAQTSIEIDTQGLQPTLPTPRPVSDEHVAAAATPSPAMAPTATPLVASPLAIPSPSPSPLPSPTPTPALVSPLPTPTLADPPAVGQSAPDFSLDDAWGGSVRLSDYRDERRVVIVFFRTTG
jgi:hypothetical protein